VDTTGDKMVNLAMQDHNILELLRVSKTFARGTVDEVKALNCIDLTMAPGDFITVIGSNGAGKSTLLNIIAGLFPPDNGGRVVIAGEDVTHLLGYRRAAYVGRVWQQPDMGTAGKLSIEENLSLALLRGKPRGFKIALNRERRRFFRTRLASLGLGLEDRLGVPAHTLSGGQRQALALIMATISNPAILLLDEHTATLDPKTARTVLSITDEIITREKMTAVMVTHNMEVALRYGNRLIMMHRGRVILDIAEEQKKGLSVTSLLGAFERAAGEEFTDDSVLLSSEL